MNHTIVKKSFYCGIIIFAVNYFFAVAKALPLLLIFSNILPGFIYAIVLCNLEGNRWDLKRILFIVLASGLYILVAWIALGNSILRYNIVLSFTVGSILGATLLLTLYYFLIDSNISFSKGLLLTSCIGLLTSIFPLLDMKVEKHISDCDIYKHVSILTILLIFPVWQTLFGWTIHTIKKATANIA